MLKRLIEVALPLKEVSEQSAREKSIRHGHISTLHIWWARRPLAACRAVVFASLIPDPDDPECPTSFKQLVMDVLGSSQFRPTQPEPSPGAVAPVETKPLEDTPRNRCLEFIKHLVRWENSNEPDYIEPARKLIQAAHKILHPDSPDAMPKVLDPFAGGGAIPLEALRLGCEAHAIDINPVAHLIQLCTLVYPQKYGRPLPPNAPVPNYIKEAAEKNGKGDGLFGGSIAEAETEYRRNPLAADVKYWGNWVIEQARETLAELYPNDPDGGTPVAYLWARTVKCPNPACAATVPLIRQTWLCKRKDRKVAARIVLQQKHRTCSFEIAEDSDIDFDPEDATFKQGAAICPFCKQTVTGAYIRDTASDQGFGQVGIAVAVQKNGSRTYRSFSTRDIDGFRAAQSLLQALEADGWIPDEMIPLTELRRLSTPLYGLDSFRRLFNDRQLATMATIIKTVRSAAAEIAKIEDTAYAAAVLTLLAMAADRLADRNSSLCRWIPQTQAIGYTFSRQALGMVWDYVEVRPDEYDSAWRDAVRGIQEVVEHLGQASTSSGVVRRGSAMKLASSDEEFDATITDPPYYDSVPYSHLADFFYVWLKRTCGDVHGEVLRTPLTPKATEMVQDRAHSRSPSVKTRDYYETEFAKAMNEISRTTKASGFGILVFAHKETAAWEILVQAILKAGLQVTATWPLHTERPGRLVAQEMAALASSIFLAFRRRGSGVGDGLWDDVRSQLRAVANERLDFFWDQGIRGADFFISAIGPALSVFGRYERVVRLSGEEVTVGQFLDEVRDLVTHYALNKIVKGGQVGHIDAESQFYVVWKWSYGDAKMPADEAFKLSQALGFSTEEMWNKTGVLEKSGQNVSAVTIAKRMKIKNLGEPKADGVPASLIDVLHRLCAFRDKGDATGAGEFLARSGHGKSQTLWLVAQAVSEILPDGDKEKQLLQGLLNQRESLQRGESKLF